MKHNVGLCKHQKRIESKHKNIIGCANPKMCNFNKPMHLPMRFCNVCMVHERESVAND